MANNPLHKYSPVYLVTHVKPMHIADYEGNDIVDYDGNKLAGDNVTDRFASRDVAVEECYVIGYSGERIVDYDGGSLKDYDS